MTEPRSSDGLHLDDRFFAAVHRLLVLALAATAFAAVWWRDDFSTLLRPLIYTLGFAAGLMFSRAFHLALYDFFNQMQYRERLLVFVIHLAIFFVPILVGYGDWMDGLAGVLVMMSFQAVREIHYNRIYAVAGLLVFVRALWLPLPPTVVVSLWMLLLLMAIRVEYVRFRLEKYSSGLGLRPRAFMGESVMTIALPWGIATVAYSILALTMEGLTRELDLEARGTVTSTEVGPVSVSSILFDAIVIIASIITALVMLQWLERKLRRKRKGETLGEDDIGHASEERRPREAPEPPPREEPDDGSPRARLIARFRAFLAEMSRAGIPREEGETAPEYLERLAHRANGLPEWQRATGGFDRACYSELPITERDADQVISLLDQIEPTLKEQKAEEKKEED